jgi:DNA-binding CsgD family transcriptional regulator
MPYLEAKARWWQALAILGAAPDDQREAARVAARAPLSAAYRIARDLPALPLLREIVDLAARARVSLPVMVQPDEATDERSVSLADWAASQGIERAVGDGASGPRPLVAVGPGRVHGPIAVGPGRSAGRSGADGSDLAQAIEERVIAALRRRPSDAYGLSPREQEVLNILAQGRTDRDIAGRLFISERTVHVHVRRILAKLGVSSRTEAAGVAIRQGLVPDAPVVPPSRSRTAPRERLT